MNQADRLILIDLLKHRGATEMQLFHRIRDHSRHQLRQSIARLESAGDVKRIKDNFEITRAGFGKLCPRER